MADLHEKIDAEFENIEQIISEIPHVDMLPKLSALELAGLGTYMQNFYNGIENILKQCLMDRNIPIPSGLSWHRDLIDLTVDNNILSRNTADDVKQYLAFRHFFIHSYSFDIDIEQMKPLVTNAQRVFENFRKDIQS